MIPEVHGTTMPKNELILGIAARTSVNRRAQYSGPADIPNAYFVRGTRRFAAHRRPVLT